MIATRGWFLKPATLFIVAVFVVGFSLFFSKSAFAATLYIDPAQSQLPRGDTVSLAVRIDVEEGECINAVDATLSYNDLIRAVDVSRGDSILSIWLEDPVIDEENRTVTFAGGIPNGYCGRIQGDPRLTNVIAEIVVRAPSFSIGRGNDTEARVTFGEETRVLLNDGLGTEASLVTQGAQLSLASSPTSAVSDDWTREVNADTQPPAAFSIELVQQDGVFGGKYFIVFNTTDKQSGIDHYEVMEEPLEESGLFKWGAVDAPWVEARSPYVLTDQNLRSTIRVRAIDKAGNERLATLVADESLRRNFMLLDLGIAAVLVVLLLIIGAVVWRARRRKKSQVATLSSDLETTDSDEPFVTASTEDLSEEISNTTDQRQTKTSRKTATKKTVKIKKTSKTSKKADPKK